MHFALLWKAQTPWYDIPLERENYQLPCICTPICRLQLNKIEIFQVYSFYSFFSRIYSSTVNVGPVQLISADIVMGSQKNRLSDFVIC
jgi:hypothetical protein